MGALAAVVGTATTARPRVRAVPCPGGLFVVDPGDVPLVTGTGLGTTGPEALLIDPQGRISISSGCGPVDQLGHRLGRWDARAVGLGGWTLDVHHTFDPSARVVHLGTGERQTASEFDRVITTAAGTGAQCGSPTGPCGDGGPATAAEFLRPTGVAVASDGRVYVFDEGALRVRRIGPDGTRLHGRRHRGELPDRD